MRFNHGVRCLFILALFGLILGSCTEKYIKLTHQGDALLERDDWDGARERYEKALRKFPKYAPALLQLGNLSMWEEDWARAEEYFNGAIEADPMMAEAYYGRGEVRLKLGKIDDAGNDLKQARDMQNEDAHLGYGIYAYIRGQYDRAFSALEKASKIPEDSFTASVYIFKTGMATKDYRTAMELLGGAVEPAASEEEADDAPLAEDEEYVPYWELSDLGMNVIRRMRADMAYLAKDYTAAMSALSDVEDGLFLGIWVREPSEETKARTGNLTGAVVEYVHLGSPAAEAGILANDIITGFERNPIRSAEAFREEVGTFEAKVTHDVALVEVLRGNQQLAFRLKPGNFVTRDLIQRGAAGAEPYDLRMVPDSWIKLP